MTTFRRSCHFICLLLLLQHNVFAFQFADAQAPATAPNSKYIFYWGQQQCDLSADNQYQGRLQVTPPAFRQMLLSAPKLWTRSGLAQDFSFELEQFQVRTAEYLQQIAVLDQRFGQKAKPGQLLSIRGLALGNTATAQIEIELTEPEKDKGPVYGYQGYAPFLNEGLLETVTWGQEDLLEISKRDFFTVSEFWQLFGQEPYLEWRSWQETQPVLAELQIIDAESVTLALRFELDKLPYRDFTEQAQLYRHLIQPGVRATLLLQTANQYERLYQKSLQLVAEQDERLSLRRERDLHTLRFRWQDWGEAVESQYLKKFVDAEGKVNNTDHPIIRRAMLGLHMDSLAYWAAQKPVFFVDNEVIADASYTIQRGDSLLYRVEKGQFDRAEFERIFSSDTLLSTGWRIGAIDLPGYDLPLLEFLMQKNMFSRMILLQQNKRDYLEKNVVQFPGYSVQAPVREGKNLKFKVEMPRRMDLIISIFDEKGWNTYWEDIIADSGATSHAIPADVASEKGKYTAYLISLFGITKVDFEIR